jgi:hypothetical protein
MLQEKEIRSLRSLRRMPLPNNPHVGNYGAFDCGHPHHVRIYPAVLRKKDIPEMDALLEEGQSACFFPPKQAATAICSISGRMICELCTTEWEGEKVSFEALQTSIKNGSAKAQENVRTKWDDIALSLSILPLLIGVITIVTAPIALGICLWFWRKGPTSPVRKSRWRYLVAGLLSVVQIGFWFWLIFVGFGG